ncbi:phosphotransferase [Actinomadura sp. LD22]|uniref:Phosphotransferase n=1 Tax=Actinomadura physcomitrii TaxID=2650748 RepID=A0A6I4M6N2_9ACTN|nr:aminoglycoside phosphotransferase family protein [Actinomadura physcomitrii]MVZ99816.1 phosphotransferase [Actinomadura physcomitrii]
MQTLNHPQQPAPRRLDDVLTPEWLTRALGARHPGIRVTEVTPGPVVSRISTNARFHIECEGGAPDGLSPDLCAKGYFSEIGWPGRETGTYEVAFYRDLAESTGMRTLRSVYAAIDSETRHGVVITEDVVARGATFLDGTSEYTPAQAAESLAELAKLHASTWGDPAVRAADWLAPRLEGILAGRGVKEIRANFESDTGAGVPAEVRDPELLVKAYRAVVSLASAATPWSVIHGDSHVGNLFLDGDGRPSFLDWQLVQRGPWYLDVGYHIASALTVEDRRRAEDDLLRHYLDGLRAGGVEAPTWDEARLGVRLGIIHGFYLWAITQKVAPAITRSLQHRLGTAAADHDAFAAVAA